MATSVGERLVLARMAFGPVGNADWYDMSSSCIIVANRFRRDVEPGGIEQGM